MVCKVLDDRCRLAAPRIQRSVKRNLFKSAQRCSKRVRSVSLFSRQVPLTNIHLQRPESRFIQWSFELKSFCTRAPTSFRWVFNIEELPVLATAVACLRKETKGNGGIF